MYIFRIDASASCSASRSPSDLSLFLHNVAGVGHKGKLARQLEYFLSWLDFSFIPIFPNYYKKHIQKTVIWKTFCA